MSSKYSCSYKRALQSKRKPMPEPPSLPIPTLEDEPDDFEAYNEQAMAIFKGQMPKCTCGRTFGDYTKLQQHQTICKVACVFVSVDGVELMTLVRMAGRIMRRIWNGNVWTVKLRKQRSCAACGRSKKLWSVHCEMQSWRLHDWPPKQLKTMKEGVSLKKRREGAKQLRKQRHDLKPKRSPVRCARTTVFRDGRAKIFCCALQPCLQERKRREEEKARLEALRRQQEEDARRNRKKFLRKGEGKQAIDERLRVDTEKVFGFGSVLPSSLYLHVPPTCFLCLFQALMQKRVRNYESCGVFTSGNTTVDEDDHWLLRDLAQKVAITEGNTSEDSPVNLKGAILNPDKGALELVQSTGCFTASSWVLNGFVIPSLGSSQ
jgi:hypothetical protein